MKHLGGLRYIAWVPALGLIYLAFVTWGLPHIAFNYTYRDDGRGYEPFARPSKMGRWYLSCTYIGYYGHFEYQTRNGTCPWFKFYKSETAGNL